MTGYRTLSILLLLLILGGTSLIYGSSDSQQGPREMVFGGQIWRIKSPRGRIAPGPNYWAHTPDAVWVDHEGLHLTLSQRDGKWYATEVLTRRPLGYGTYTFTIDSDISAYTPNVVAGFFTWDTDREEANREIDIEFSSWGEPSPVEVHYAVQPITSSERKYSFDPQLQGNFTTHRIEWTPEQISFSSYHGHIDPDSPEAQDFKMAAWTFLGTPPTEGKAHFRINLWLFRGRTEGAKETHLTVRSFLFEPWNP